MTLSHEQYVERATRGYQFLASSEGQRLGFNVHLLNPDTLDLSDACGCALGETYEMGNYWDAAERLAEEGYLIVTLDDVFLADISATEDKSLTYLWERMHGFMLLPLVEAPIKSYAEAPSTIKSYAALTDAWREVIKKEREQQDA